MLLFVREGEAEDLDLVGVRRVFQSDFRKPFLGVDDIAWCCRVSGEREPASKVLPAPHQCLPPPSHSSKRLLSPMSCGMLMRVSVSKKEESSASTRDAPASEYR